MGCNYENQIPSRVTLSQVRLGQNRLVVSKMPKKGVPLTGFKPASIFVIALENFPLIFSLVFPLNTHRAVGEYSTVPNISPYTIIKFLEGLKYQDGTKYIFWTSKYKFWPK